MKVLRRRAAEAGTLAAAVSRCSWSATAPLAADGHVNVSPKGMAGTFAVFDPHRVGYLDYFGSGAETIAHLRENGRITLMFTAFSGRPTVVRLYGRGRVVLVDDPEFAELRGQFPQGSDGRASARSCWSTSIGCRNPAGTPCR